MTQRRGTASAAKSSRPDRQSQTDGKSTALPAGVRSKTARPKTHRARLRMPVRGSSPLLRGSNARQEALRVGLSRKSCLVTALDRRRLDPPQCSAIGPRRHTFFLTTLPGVAFRSRTCTQYSGQNLRRPGRQPVLFGQVASPDGFGACSSSNRRLNLPAPPDAIGPRDEWGSERVCWSAVGRSRLYSRHD